MPAPSPGPDRSPGLLGLVVEAPSDGAPLRLQGRPLVAHAADALATVRGLDVRVVGPAPRGTRAVARSSSWRPLVSGGLLLHDARCPLLPGSALREAVQLLSAAGPSAVLVGVRPVTDTIKEVVDGAVVGTVDRDTLSALASPVVVGADLLDPLADALPLAGQLADLPAVLGVLDRIGARVVPHEVPSGGRRLSDADDVVLMECLHGLSRTLRAR
jgi:2-C-methyl-D-erythritol 4-phosphate cytidylyltransferase